jgi:CMP-N-acetylneuraminic acid synthetase
MSTNFSARMNARRNIKKEFVESRIDTDELEVLGVIPARQESRIEPPTSEETVDNLAVSDIAGRPLIEYCVKEALSSVHIDRLVVSTEDNDIAAAAESAGAEVPFMRKDELSNPTAGLPEVIESILNNMYDNNEPDLVTVLPYITPLRTAEQIDEAINTSMMFSVDSVISVCENKNFLWRPGKYGLEPLFKKRLLRRDRETMYYENGAIYVTTPETVRNQGELVGQHVGHILMKEENSVHIDSWFDYITCEHILSENLIDYMNNSLNR